MFHLAAQALVPIANRNAVSTFDTNVRGTWSLLEACRRCPTVKQVIIASSGLTGSEYARTSPSSPNAMLTSRFAR